MSANLHRTPGLWTLHAIAGEIDRREATVVPDARICRGCGGRGLVLATATAAHPSTGLIRYHLDAGHPYVGAHAVSEQPCPCDGPTRTDTVSLAWLVAYLAEQRTPAFDFPAAWLVDMDRREAAGDGSWRAVWWAQFWGWTRGLPLDVERLRDAWARSLWVPAVVAAVDGHDDAPDVLPGWMHRSPRDAYTEPPRVVGIAGCRVTHQAENVAHVVPDASEFGSDLGRYALRIDGHLVEWFAGHEATIRDMYAVFVHAIADSTALRGCTMMLASDGLIITLPPRVRFMGNPEPDHWMDRWIEGTAMPQSVLQPRPATVQRIDALADSMADLDQRIADADQAVTDSRAEIRRAWDRERARRTLPDLDE